MPDTESRFPAPLLQDPYARTFYDYCGTRELRVQRCRRCRRWRHPPRALCAACGAFETEWERCAGTGALYTWTVTVRALLPSLAAAVPYVTGVVALDEGVRIVARVVGIDPVLLRLDLPLRVAFESGPDGMTVPVFGPRDAEFAQSRSA